MKPSSSQEVVLVMRCLPSFLFSQYDCLNLHSQYHPCILHFNIHRTVHESWRRKSQAEWEEKRERRRKERRDVETLLMSWILSCIPFLECCIFLRHEVFSGVSPRCGSLNLQKSCEEGERLSLFLSFFYFFFSISIFLSFSPLFPSEREKSPWDDVQSKKTGMQVRREETSYGRVDSSQVKN